MAYIRINNKVFYPTPEEQDVHGREEELQAAVNAGEITPEAAADITTWNCNLKSI